MKKILFIMQMPPPLHGASTMNKSIQDSQLINNSYQCTYINLSAARSIEDMGKNGFKKYIQLIKMYYKVFKALLHNNYDLCYITLTPSGIGFIKDSLVVLILKVFQKNTVFHFHGKGMSRYYNNSSKLLRKYIQFIFRDINVIHLSKELLKDLKDINHIRFFSIVANGIPLNPICTREKKTSDKITKILFLSSMIESKGVFSALNVVVILSKLTKDFSITFVGAFRDRLYEEQVLNFVKSNHIEKYVNIMGSIYGDEKFVIYKKHDLFFAPTKNDAFPLVILEAMQCGMPIVSTFQGGIPDMVEDNKTGFLIDENNFDMMAEKIHYFIQNKDAIKQFGDVAKNTFLEKYTLTVFEKHIFDTLNKILKEKK